MKQSVRKRLLALMLVLAVVLGWLPGNPVSHALAETETPDAVSRTGYVADDGVAEPDESTAYAAEFDMVDDILGGEQPEETSAAVVYVDGNIDVSGDGKSAATACKTLEEAYALLAQNSPGDGGTIVICGDISLSGTVDMEAYPIAGTVEITSAYGTEAPYPATVTFADKTYFCPSQSTYIHDITFASEGVTYFYTGENMVLGENISAFAPAAKYGLKLFCTGKSGTADDQISVTINSGTYHSVYMGGNTGSVAGDIELTMNGGTVTTYLVAGPNSSAKKPSSARNVTFTMNGGSVATLCDTPNTNGTAGDVTIHLKNGTLATAMEAYGSGHTMNSVTVNLYNTFGVIPAAFGNWESSAVAGGTVLNLLGYSGEVFFGGYDVINLRDNANVTCPGVLDTETITVEAGSTLVLTHPDYSGPDKLPAAVTVRASVGGTVTDGTLGKVYYTEIQYPEAVYVNGSSDASKDGLTAENAVRTLDEAAALLDPVNGGTIVICGETNLSGTADLEGYEIAGQVTLTSVYGGVDYAADNGAALIFGSKAYLYCGDHTCLRDITLNGSAGTVYLFCGRDMVIGEQVNAFGTLKLFCCNKTPASSPENAENFSLSVSSGYYDTIFMGPGSSGVYVGDVDVTVDGSASMRLLVVGGNKGNTGDLTATINGGTITSKICNTPNEEGAGVGNVVINLFGGSVKSMVGYNSKTHYGKSAVINVDVSAAKNIPASLGYWDALYLPGTTTRIPLILNYLNYDGTAVDADGYDLVNLFGDGTVPEDYASAREDGKRVLRIHGFSGMTSVDLSRFDQMNVTGGSDVTCAGAVPTGLVLSAEESVLRIRPSQNPGVTLGDYTIIKNDLVLMEEPPYTSHEVIFSMDFENEYALGAGDGVAVQTSSDSVAGQTANNGVAVQIVSNGYVTPFATGGFAAGYDGNTALYLVNEFGAEAQNYIRFDLGGSGRDITRDDYTVTFWYKTENGGNDQWSRSVHATTVGTDVNMPSYNMGGVIFSNQDTAQNGSGMSLLQLPHNKYGAAGLTGGNGAHCDIDGIWQIQDDSWHYIAVTYDRDGFYRVYVDGELVGVSDISAYAGEAIGVNALVFGADALGQYGLGNAFIDDIVVYSGALDIVDVQAEYNVDRIRALADEIENRLEATGNEYDPYKAELAAVLADVLAQAEGLGAADYEALGGLYNTLVSAYESFMAAPEKDALLTVLLTSDIHLGASGTSENISLVLNQLNELGIDPDVLLSAGDFADNPTDATVRYAYEYLYELMESCGMSDTLFVGSLGNHDAYWKAEDANYQTAIPLYWQYMMERMGGMIESGTVTLDHASYYTDDNNIVQSCSYAVTFRGYHFLVINTDYLPQTGNSALILDENGNYSVEGNLVDPIRHTAHISDESFEWMEDVLDTWAKDGKPVFAVCHYLFKDTAPLSFDSEIVINSNTVGKQDQQLRELLASYKNVFYFCGHVHANFGVIEPYPVEVDGVGSFWEINLSSMKSSARGYIRIPSVWVMYVYEDEVVLRARDYTSGRWLTRFDQIVGLVCGHGEDEVEHIDAVEASCTEAGNIEYWHCSGCGRYFSDAGCAAEISLEDTVIPAAGHAFTRVEAVEATETKDGNREYYRCERCGRYYTDAEGKTEIAPEDTVIPAQGTAGSDDPEVTGPAEETDATEPTETPDTTESETPDTGDKILLFPMILGMTASIGVVYILCRKKKWI